MLSEFHAALEKTTEKICRVVAKKYKLEGIYAFALYTSGEYSYVLDSFSTQDGLKIVAETYLKEKHYREEWKNVNVAMRELKWSPCDSPHHCEFEEEFAHANSILETLWESADADSIDASLETCRRIHDVFTQVLRKIRVSRIFDDSVILNVLMGDQSDEERFLNAEPLNSTAAVFDFERQLQVDPKILTQIRKSRWKM